jgi:hypothetical protein
MTCILAYIVLTDSLADKIDKLREALSSSGEVDAIVPVTFITNASVEASEVRDAQIGETRIADAIVTSATVVDAGVAASDVADTPIGIAVVSNASVSNANVSNTSVSKAPIVKANVLREWHDVVQDERVGRRTKRKSPTKLDLGPAVAGDINAQGVLE